MGYIPITEKTSERVSSREELQEILIDTFDKVEEFSNNSDCDIFSVNIRIGGWVGTTPDTIGGTK